MKRSAASTVVSKRKRNRNDITTKVQFIIVVEHPNLVKLIEYRVVDGERRIQRLLVYEFMPNRRLQDHRFNKSYPTLPWQRRLHILFGAAQGLACLHEELEAHIM
ncbi:hypothetical protein RJ640_015310 [Escallonia rubra]|uniref:Protein kinase domain-containing protein n=1 Tax=Escallonia rubra TaxID=112253 RepID=A0AA88R0Z2_9ASTE|nr:hypothetical protein RJ640_015310 [Escallonia rubra]